MNRPAFIHPDMQHTGERLSEVHLSLVDQIQNVAQVFTAYPGQQIFIDIASRIHAGDNPQQRLELLQYRTAKSDAGKQRRVVSYGHEHAVGHTGAGLHVPQACAQRIQQPGVIAPGAINALGSDARQMGLALMTLRNIERRLGQFVLGARIRYWRIDGTGNTFGAVAKRVKLIVKQH
ncbi:hypothetical protein C5I_0103745 [Pseudomonas syringae pv. syringae FF5]|nr:hypothetical protein C5I_0103745 [Pseudomonas syringae pv. syringae FF5]